MFPPRWIIPPILLACTLGTALSAPAEPGAAPRGPRVPLLVAHRGLLRHAPENTLASFTACLGLGLGFETDLRRTRDGRLVCIHDATVDRTTDGTGADPGTHAARLVQGPEELAGALPEAEADWIYVRFVPSRPQVEAIHRAGKRVFIAGPLVAAGQPESWKLARERGLDAILTDEPLEVRQLWRSLDRGGG